MSKEKPAARKPAQKADKRPAKKPAKRRPGRPKRSEPVVTPAMILGIAEYWLKGWGTIRIGQEYGIDPTTVRHHLDKTVRPQWHEEMRSRLAEDMAKVDLVERTAWERFHAAEPGETREVVEKALLEGGSKPQIIKQVKSAVTKTGEVAWIQVIQWCLDFRARIHAHYAPTRHKVDLGSELRVAGLTPDQVDQAMLKRLMETIEERRKYQQALGSGDN